MKRRAFLQLVGAFAASAAIPKALAIEGICRAQEWWSGPVQIFRTAPLVAGVYTFTTSKFFKHGSRENLGYFVGGFKAKGGETLIEMPDSGEYVNPSITIGGLTWDISPEQWKGSTMEQWKPTFALTPVEKL